MRRCLVAALGVAVLAVGGCAPASPRREGGASPSARRALRSGAEPVFVVRVRYADGKVALRGVEVRTAWASKRPLGGTAYAVVLRDAAGEELTRLGFGVPSARLPGPDAGRAGARPVPVDRMDLAVQLPWLAAARSVALVGEAGVLDEQPTPPRPPAPPPPGPLAPVTVYEGCIGDPAGCLDLLFIAGDYVEADLGAFASTVAAHAAHLLTVEPYASRAGLINVRRLDNTTDLGCSMGMCPTCDDALVFGVAAQAPYDEIVVLAHASGFQGCGDFTVGGGGAQSYARVMFGGGDEVRGAQLTVHELGHSFGALMDEYLVWAEPAGPNCSQAGCASWAGLPGTGCFPGCSVPELFRSTDDGCLMKTLEHGVFCPVCDRAVASLLDCLGRDCTGTPSPGECDTGPAVCNNWTAGACGYVHRTDGTACGGDLCSATCQQGICAAGVPVVCSPPASDCLLPATCDPATGCVYPPQVDGSPCDDGRACTSGDACAGGGCVGTELECPPRQACEAFGYCTEPDGVCEYSAPRPDGTSCDTPCNVDGLCRAGACVGGTPRSCDDGRVCTYDSCDPEAGCVHMPLTGIACGTGPGCPDDGVCRDGECAGMDAGACGRDGGADGADVVEPPGNGCGCAAERRPGGLLVALLALLGLIASRRRAYRSAPAPAQAVRCRSARPAWAASSVAR